MSFAYMNAYSAQGSIPFLQSGASAVGVISGEYPLFQVAAPVDVSGIELAVVNIMDATTAGTQAMATGTTTVVLKPFDGATTAAAASDNNELFAVTDFSNSATGTNSWTGARNAMKATGTSTTDLDADDWIVLDVAANITGAAGLGTIGYNAYIVHGIPGTVGS